MDCTGVNAMSSYCQNQQAGATVTTGAGYVVTSAWYMYVINIIIIVLASIPLYQIKDWKSIIPTKFFGNEAGLFWCLVLVCYLGFFTLISFIVKMYAYYEQSSQLQYDSYLTVLVPSLVLYIPAVLFFLVVMIVSIK